MTMQFRWYSMVNSYNKSYADFGNGVGIQTDNLRTTDTDWFRTKGAVNNTVCTNLDYDVSSIIKINQKRWEIEECFRIMKTEFKARPVYLSRKDRITAHFTTCFTALVIYRILEQKLKEKYTCEELIDTIRAMDMLIAPGEGYIPTYTRTDITDALHDAFGFRTDYQITSQKNMRKILNQTKKK